MAPKETQKIEIEKTHRDPLLSFNQALTMDGANFLGTALKEMVENYRIELELPTRLDKPSRLEVKLSEGSRVRWKGARLNYPTELTSCNP
jgi:hypothetical protein